MENINIDLESKSNIGKENTQIERITMTPSEVSVMLGISTGTVYKMVREKEIPHFRVRSKILFNRDIITALTKEEFTKSS